MCSVFGYVAEQNRPVDLKIIREIVAANVCRGPHALGFSWVDVNGRLRQWKAPGNPMKMLGMLEMMRSATMIIGHVRYATHGDPKDNITNHPHPCDGGWIVHNGVISGYAQLVSKYRLVPTSVCDSEIIGMLAERSEEKTHMGRLISAVEAVGAERCVVMGLWSRPRKMVICRAGNPLHIGRLEGTGYYIGSLNAALPGKVWQLKDMTAIEFTCRGIATDIQRDTIAGGNAGAPASPGWVSRDASGAYRGG